jgi:drug/metabolite transporter (DMT)-like permease
LTHPPPPTCSTTLTTTTSESAEKSSSGGGGGGSSGGSTRTLGRYALLALIDTQANYCIVKSFQYTSLTSVTLLDCAAIPFSMALSAAMMGGVYSVKHVAGGVVSIAGLAILVFADASGGDEGSGGSNPALGDCLVLLAAVGLYKLNLVDP